MHPLINIIQYNIHEKTIWTIVVIAIVLLLVTSGSKKDDSKTTAGDKGIASGPIKIGFVGALTGDVAALGAASRAGVEVAAEEINAAGGINGRSVEVIYEDGKCGAGAASAAQKLMNVDKVFMIIGGLCSGETSSFVKPAMDQKVPVISYLSSAPTLTGSGKYFFRDYPSDTFQGKFAAEYLYNVAKARKVAVLYQISDWGTGVKAVFEKRFAELGGEIVLSEGAQSTVRDYRTQLSKIKTLNPDYIYAPLFPEGGIMAMTQIKELGIKTKVLGADAWSDTTFAKGAAGKADILYSEVVTGTNPDFAAKVSAKTKSEQVSVGAAQAYDALKLSAEVLKKTGTNPDAFADELRKQDYQGISGRIQFDANGDLLDGQYVVKRVGNDGKITEVK